MGMAVGFVAGLMTPSGNAPAEGSSSNGKLKKLGKNKDRDQETDCTKNMGKDKGKERGYAEESVSGDYIQGGVRQSGYYMQSNRGGGGGLGNPWAEIEGPKYQKEETKKERLTRVAKATLDTLRRGSYEYRGEIYDIGDSIRHTIKATIFYPEKSTLDQWKRPPSLGSQGKREVAVSILNVPTLNAAKILANSYRFTVESGQARARTGVLNFASATQPGGGFKNGAEAQEESLARVSSLYVSLDSKDGKRFYEVHRNHHSHYYTHSMVWSPGVVVIHNDHGESVQGYEIDVVSSAAVNAGKILEDKLAWQTAGAEIEIEGAMKERMGRVLYLFEIQDVRNIVLGTFGTGVFKNKISEVARIWAELLVAKDARFKYSFDRVVFAITGDSTFAEFRGRFEGYTRQKETARPATGVQRSAWLG